MPCGPAPDGNDQPFWEGLREERLLLPRCVACGRWRALGRLICPSCWAFETSWEEVAPRGCVFSWVRSHRAFMSELDVPVPYVTVLVELDGVAVRLLGILRGDDLAPRIGDRVTGFVEQPDKAAWPILRWRAEAQE